jgi:hypothetical protein
VADPIAQQIKMLEKKLKAIAEKEVPRAAVTALNKVAKPVVGAVAKAVAQKEKLPAKIIRPRVVYRKATFNSRSAFVKSFTRGINAICLLSDATIAKRMGKGTSKKGVTVRGRVLAGAFINRVRRNGNAFVFERRGAARYPLDVKRIPIDEALLSIQLPLARGRFNEHFHKFYLHELQYRLSKYGR